MNCLCSVFDSWYKRSEFGMRAAVFFSAATVSPFSNIDVQRAHVTYCIGVM